MLKRILKSFWVNYAMIILALSLFSGLALDIVVAKNVVEKKVTKNVVVAKNVVETKVDSNRVEKLDSTVFIHKQLLGSKFKARNRTGSAYYLSPLELKKVGSIDINRILSSIPGVTVCEEDGFGLRPNISLRGTRAERSERISIMEDGILASPAPYSAPAAYYFPNAGRMHAVEVLKGSSQVQYGPFTTGGAINMVSTPIPEKFTLFANVSYGKYSSLKGHIYTGNMHKYWGYMIEYLRYSSDGFKYYDSQDIGNSVKNDKNKGAQTRGFVRNDFIAKFMVRNNKNSFVNQNLEFKFGFADEDSDETYLGLSSFDYERQPYLRYPGSMEDNMKNRHYQSVLTHSLNVGHKFSIISNVYYNHFFRNWYKLNDVRASYIKEDKYSIAAILNDPITLKRYFDILTGEVDNSEEALFVRANNRKYDSYGVQTKVDYKFTLRNFIFDSEWGIRYHKDSEDRFQWEDAYSMIDKKMNLVYKGVGGSQSNRITSAKALSTYFLLKTTYNNLTVTTGLRYEGVKLLKKDFGKHDPLRTGAHRLEIPNNSKTLIPSIGLNYKPFHFLNVFAGAHRGFSPPSAELYRKPEKSLNLELGTRLTLGELYLEAIGFYNHFRNMLGSDLSAAGGLGTLDQFDIGKAKVYGLESLLQCQILPKSWPLKLPVKIQYTFTETSMLNSFVAPSWGVVKPHDEIPYIYKHSISGSIGLEYNKFEIQFSARYKSDMRTSPGQGKLAERNMIPSSLIFDASSKYRITKKIAITLNAINLTNKVYLVSRHPSGYRPGHPFSFSGGVIVNL